MSSKTLSVRQQEFSAEACGLVKDLQKTLDYTKNRHPETKAEIKAWAEKFVEEAGVFIDRMDEFANRVAIAEFFKEIDWKENEPLMKMLLDVVNSVNRMTETMYSVLNYFYMEILDTRRAVLEKRLKKEEAEKERQMALESERKLAHEAEELEKKRIEEERLDNEMRRIATERAMKNYALWVQQKKAAKALSGECGIRDHHDESVVISSPGEETILDDTIIAGSRRRRSRSLGRFYRSVKDTVRRSISHVHRMLDHHH